MPLPENAERMYIRPESTSHYSVTSPSTDDYNCIAWAAGRDDVWAWPGRERYHWWPPNLPRVSTVEAIAAWFISIGYEAVASSEAELGYERVAIYANTDGLPTHVARQLPDGSWTSKIGMLEDIRHLSPRVLETDQGYGYVKLVLRRKMPATNQP